jgi:molecular chaperone DnaK (HSP70)
MNSFSSLSLNDRKIIVGIDFGTTFSGVAWAETRRVGIRYFEAKISHA